MKYYFDGCSYTKGHDESSSLVSWPKQINPKADPNYGHVNLLNDDKIYRLYPFIDYSCTARSNDAMFISFMTHLDEIIANKTKVFIFFSHSERNFTKIDISESKNHRPLNSRLHYNKVNPNGDITEWFSGTIKTLSYIKSITHIAEANDIDLVIVTQDHYRWFEFVSKIDNKLEECFNNINKKYIFNWPMPELKNFNFFNNYPDNFNYNQVLELWGCTGFALQMAKGFSDFNNWVCDDLKHFTEEGHMWLSKALKDFLKDRSKNLSYYVDELDLGKQRIFYDKNAWVESYFYGKKTSHWIEDNLISHFESLIKDIEKNKNYIYES